MKKLVLLRHGESLWNKENRFTGWVDVGLSDKGADEAVNAGRTLKKEGFAFDVAHTSVLQRAIKTLWLALEEMGLMWIPQHAHWRLNERHYGSLQGLNKAETAAKHGETQVKIWRRSYDIAPPPLDPEAHLAQRKDPRYAALTPEEMPHSESLKDTIARVLPYWHERIAPDLKAGKCVLVAAHGNSIRGLIMYLDNIPETEIPKLEVATGVPVAYELDDDLKVVSSHSLPG